MFTGIVDTVGLIVAIEASNGDLRLRINTATMNLSNVHVGDSIATNGVCLTVVDLPGDGFWADVSAETLAVTTIASWQPRMAVNLEKALTPSTPIGGHIVSGHVDGVAEVVKRKSDGRSQRFTLEMPLPLAKYIAQKGSITLDGVSLTVNAVDECQFDVNIVPHTWSNTIMRGYQPGTLVNVEVDLMARYVERLVLGQQASPPKGLTTAFLQENGFFRK